LVGTDGRLEGVVTARRLKEAVDAGRLADAIASLVERPVVHAHPDHSLDLVFERLPQSAGMLPVVKRDNAALLAGVITVQDIVAFLQSRR
jgi:CBS domain-containing protein